MAGPHLTDCSPLWGAHWRSIPQWVTSDIGPLVKSAFWETKLFPNECFDFDPSTLLCLGTTFLFLGLGGGSNHLVERLLDQVQACTCTPCFWGDLGGVAYLKA